ncbi:hypothetical protein FSARC_10028 [Fusarium sarcochroum]|uniref:Uncharacterized protein n=1 Tax=Fusarium sarcochroum TaxID=1208366 RepID=A0A8H4TQ55_9HYPO|nr:hypothetical protein FSARC_10028 [Fusarium sarcochroum]
MDLTRLLNESDDSDVVVIPPPPTETRTSHIPHEYRWPQSPRNADAYDAPEASGSQSYETQPQSSGPRYCLNCEEPMTPFKLRCDPCKQANEERLSNMMPPPEFRYCIVCRAGILGDSVLCDTHKCQEGILTTEEKRTLRGEATSPFRSRDNRGLLEYDWTENLQGTSAFGSQSYDAQSYDTQLSGSQGFGTYDSQLDDPQFCNTQSIDTQTYGTQSYGSQQYDPQFYSTQSSGSQLYSPQFYDAPFNDPQSYGSQSYSSQTWETQPYSSRPYQQRKKEAYLPRKNSINSRVKGYVSRVKRTNLVKAMLTARSVSRKFNYGSKASGSEQPRWDAVENVRTDPPLKDMLHVRNVGERSVSTSGPAKHTI